MRGLLSRLFGGSESVKSAEKHKTEQGSSSAEGSQTDLVKKELEELAHQSGLSKGFKSWSDEVKSHENDLKTKGPNERIKGDERTKDDEKTKDKDKDSKDKKSDKDKPREMDEATHWANKLVEAVEKNMTHTAEFLLQSGVKPFVPNDRGVTPLQALENPNVNPEIKKSFKAHEHNQLEGVGSIPLSGSGSTQPAPATSGKGGGGGERGR